MLGKILITYIAAIATCWGSTTLSLTPLAEQLDRLEKTGLPKTSTADFDAFRDILDQNITAFRSTLVQKFATDPDLEGRLKRFDAICETVHNLKELRSFEYAYAHILLANALSEKPAVWLPLSEVRKLFDRHDLNELYQNNLFAAHIKNAVFLPIVVPNTDALENLPIQQMNRAFANRVIVVPIPLSAKEAEGDFSDDPVDYATNDLDNAGIDYARRFFEYNAFTGPNFEPPSSFPENPLNKSVLDIASKIYQAMAKPENPDAARDHFIFKQVFLGHIQGNGLAITGKQHSPVSYPILQEAFSKGIAHEFAYPVDTLKNYWLSMVGKIFIMKDLLDVEATPEEGTTLTDASDGVLMLLKDGTYFMSTNRQGETQPFVFHDNSYAEFKSYLTDLTTKLTAFGYPVNLHKPQASGEGTYLDTTDFVEKFQKAGEEFFKKYAHLFP